MNHSTQGRPRRITDRQVTEILAWADARVTNGQKAAQLGISRGTLEKIIRTRGEHYKQASPERRRVVLTARRERLVEALI